MGLIGGILPAMYEKYEEKQDENDAKMAAMKKQAMQGAAATQAPVAQGMKKGGKVSSASSRADGCAVKGKTRGKYL